MNTHINKNQHITPDFIELLRLESNKALDICISLNANAKYKKGIESILNLEFKDTNYKSQHLLLRDIVLIYNTYSGMYDNLSKIPIKAKFILIFLYEKLQGKNSLESLTIEKLQQLTLSNQIHENVRLIQKISFFEPIDSLKAEFVSPFLLSKLSSPFFNSISSFINRIALLMAQSDHIISSEEEKMLKTISKKINNPKIAIDQSHYSDIPENDSLEKVMNELNSLIGLDHIKKNVIDLTNFLKIQKIRKENGLKINQNSLHTVFMGPPGTGKTTVARMLGRIFKHLGYLKKGHLIETDRAGMVAGYVGQTAIKVDEIITSAKDGVLFIDEAYSLTNGGHNDFGKEAIEVLLKRMEDHRKNLVVIVAGYPNEMEIFIQSNPGLQSRFNRYFTFNHYKEKTLLEIFKLNAHKADFKLTPDAEEKLSDIIHGVYKKRHKGFGNARTMRNLFEKIIERQANRIISIPEISKDVLVSLTEEDIPEIKKTIKEIIVFDQT